MHVAAGADTTTTGSGGSSLSFLTCGDKQLKFWSLAGRNLNSSKVILGSKGKIQHYFAVIVVKGFYLVGCDDGYIYVIGADGKSYYYYNYCYL